MAPSQTPALSALNERSSRVRFCPAHLPGPSPPDKHAVGIVDRHPAQRQPLRLMPNASPSLPLPVKIFTAAGLPATERRENLPRRYGSSGQREYDQADALTQFRRRVGRSSPPSRPPPRATVRARPTPECHVATRVPRRHVRRQLSPGSIKSTARLKAVRTSVFDPPGTVLAHGFHDRKTRCSRTRCGDWASWPVASPTGVASPAELNSLVTRGFAGVREVAPM